MGALNPRGEGVARGRRPIASRRQLGCGSRASSQGFLSGSRATCPNHSVTAHLIVWAPASLARTGASDPSDLVARASCGQAAAAVVPTSRWFEPRGVGRGTASSVSGLFLVQRHGDGPEASTPSGDACSSHKTPFSSSTRPIAPKCNGVPRAMSPSSKGEQSRRGRRSLS
jgi:hypothetical protein